MKAAEAAFQRLLTEATPRVFITPIIIALNLAVFVAMLATGVSFFAPQGEQLLKWGADSSGQQPRHISLYRGELIFQNFKVFQRAASDATVGGARHLR